MPVLLEKDSLALVTGANGLLGSHVVDQFLAEGYKVRGTVRNLDKSQWLQEYFDKKYGPNSFSLVEVKDFTQDDCLVAAVKGVRAFVHVASDVSLSPDPNAVIPSVIKAVQNALTAAAAEPGLKAFVLTSSSTAAASTKLNTKFHINKESWNEEAVTQAWAPAPYESERAWTVYFASKTQAEQHAWAWIKQHKPHFVFNAVLPNLNIGNILDTKNQSGSTAGWVKNLTAGSWEILQNVPPQHYVHPVDTARLHVAAATDTSIRNERIFAYAEPFTWKQVFEIYHKLQPEAVLPTVDSDDRDLSTVDNHLASEILRSRFGQDGFLPLEKGITDAVLC